MHQKGGILKLVILIVAIVLLLSYLNIDIGGLVSKGRELLLTVLSSLEKFVRAL